MRTHISPNLFRFIAFMMVVVGVIVAISAGVVTAVPLFAFALLMSALWWYQRWRLTRS